MTCSWRHAVGLVLVMSLGAVPPTVTAARTVTTTYQYNADGALTAVTTTSGGGEPATTYLTWDNFTPNAADPATGSVTSADGNLLSINDRPGAVGATTQLTYDQRDRLVGCGTAGQPPVAYAYHPASLMASSTLASGDALQFYYGNGSAPQASNLRQPSSGTAASFLGPVYYLSDGGEQVLLGPRKDIAGIYTPQAETLVPYAYDPYGAPSGYPPSPLGEDGASYDLHQIPFRYTGEYEDLRCGLYYLRARWYAPLLQMFISRDRVEPMRRYGYTGGNPVTRTDPTGLSYASFRRHANRFMARLGLGALALSLVPGIGEAMFAVQLSANYSSYFHSWSDLAMVGVGAAAAVSEPLEFARDVGTAATFERGQRIAMERYAGNRAIHGRAAIDALVGGAQSVIAGFGGGKGKHFDSTAFLENMGVTAGTMLVGRSGLGVGYRPFRLDASDVDTLVAGHFNGNVQATDALVFRVRQRSRIGPLTIGGTSPLTELAQFNLTSAFPYHEGLLVFTSDTVFLSSLRGAVYEGERMDSYVTTHWARQAGWPGTPGLIAGHARANYDFAFVGERPSGPAGDLFGNLHASGDLGGATGTSRFTNRSHVRFNNCHRYVAQMLSKFDQMNYAYMR